MKTIRRLSLAVACVAALQLQITASGATSPSFAHPDKAVLTSVTGLLSGTSLIDDTVNGDNLFINAYYAPSDRWLLSYIPAGGTITLNWTVTGSNGQPLANTAVTLQDNLAYSSAQGTTWSQSALNVNNGSSPGGTISGTTNANGNVSFTITNTNSLSGTPPSDLASTSGAESNEGKYPWTCMILQVGNDVWTSSPASGVNEATDRVDFIVVPAAKPLGTTAAKVTTGNKSFVYGASGVSVSAAVKSATSGTVLFTAGGHTLCSASVSAGSASCAVPTTALNVGSYQLTAAYSGNATYAAASASSTLNVTIDPTTLSVTPSVLSLSQSVLGTFSVAVTLSSKTGVTPSGTATLSLDGTQLATDVTTYKFSSLDASAIGVGKHTVTVSYSGNTNFKPVTVSKTITVTAATTPLPVTLPSTSTNYDVAHGNLLWSESFTNPAYTGINTSIWSAEIGQYVGNAPGLPAWGYGTGEIETNTNQALNISEDGLGNLALTAVNTNGNWTSARISTAGKVNFQYGQIEANIKMPAGSYNWPAFWMLGKNFFPNSSWPNCGEIDIMEGLANESVDQSTLHANYPGGGDWNGGGGVTMRAPLSNLTSAFHTFGMIWTPTSISFTLDGYVYGSDVYNASNGTVTQTVGSSVSTFSIGGKVWPFNQQFFMILDNAIPAGTSAANGARGTMDVNWIKYYSYDGLGAVTN